MNPPIYIRTASGDPRPLGSTCIRQVINDPGPFLVIPLSRRIDSWKFLQKRAVSTYCFISDQAAKRHQMMVSIAIADFSQ
jgi:hypothetical protein